MKKPNITLLLAAVTLIMSCEQVELEMPNDPNAPVALRLNSGIATVAATTRAFDTQWEAADEIGVFTVEAGETDASKITKSGEDYDQNVKYIVKTSDDYSTYDNTDPANPTYTYRDFDAASSPIYLPADGSNVDVYAYYPYISGTTAAAGTTLSLATDNTATTGIATQTTTNQKKIDLMKASALSSSSAINRKNPGAALKFEHCMSKILIRLIIGTGYSKTDFENKVSVKITHQPYEATFMPLAQTLTVTTATEDFISIVPAKLESTDADYMKSTETGYSNMLYCYRALLFPNDSGDGAKNPVTTDATRQILFTVDNNGHTSTYTHNIDDTYAANTQIIYTLTLGASGVSVTAAIQPWSTSTTNPSDPLYEETGE